MKTSMIYYFIQCLTTKYCCFSGRARRKEIWSFYLILIAILAVYWFYLLRSNLPSNDFARLLTPNKNSYSTLIISVLLFLPVSGLNVRRLHDVGMSGFWTLPTIILHLVSIYGDIKSLNDPYAAISSLGNTVAFISDYAVLCGIYALYSFIIAIISLFFGSQKKENKYGEIPLR